MIGFTCGAFDLFHPGHVVLLYQCKQYCDQLIVGLQTNPQIDRSEKSKPIQSLYERYLQLSSCRYVDSIVPYDTEKDLENILSCTKLNIRFLGEDYEDKSFTGKDICEKLNIQIIYLPRKHSWSSTELRKRL